MTTTGKWLLRPPSPDATTRLLCFPFAGVGASALRRWPERIGPLEVCRVQLPGRENRLAEPPYHDFSTFAADAARALEPALDRPYALFGHCMGALLAHALLVRLVEIGAPLPQRVFVSSSLVPHRGFFGPFHPEMSDERLTEDLVRISRATGAGDPLPELLPLTIRVLRNDVQMCFDHRPAGPYPLAVPVSTIGWTDDADVAPAEMAEWADYAPVRRHELPGDAFTFLAAPPPLLELIERDFAADRTAAAPTEGAR
jgi:surfactin synthase thioesterase subunit